MEYGLKSLVLLDTDVRVEKVTFTVLTSFLLYAYNPLRLCKGLNYE